MESINYLINFVLIVAAALTAWLPAEAAEPMRDPSGEPARQIELDPGVTPKSDRPAVVLERGPDHRVVEWYSEILDESGTSLTLTNRYTEVATGLHFLDAKGEWYETVAAFEEVPNGWVAARGPHQVALSTDLSVPGSVTVVTVDGVTLRSTPTLLAYVDRSTGQEVHLASLRPTRGELILPGTVLYPNAFDAVAADVRAIYTAAGFECDVILRGALPNPAEFGLNPDTTDLAVFTEFFETQPTKRRDYEAQIHDGELATDVDLDFGAMRMDRGRAFLAPSSEGGELPVRKNWENREGRDFLIERTAWKDLELLFQRLPEGAAAPKSDRAVGKPTASAQLKLPERLGSLPTWPRSATGRLLAGAIRSGRTDEAGVAVASRHLGSGAISPRSFQVSRVSDNRPGVVLDYTLVGTTTDYTFNSLTTYYVSGAVTLGGSGNTVTFQPGTVVKYAKTNTPSLKLLSGTTINWLGAPYRPVVLTAYDDNSVGELLPGATGNPQGTYAYKALELDGAGRTTPMALTNLCIRHAGIGLAAAYFSSSTAILTVRHAQIIHCDGAFQFQLGSTTTDTYRVQNALLYSTNSGNIAFKNQYAARCVGEFLTVRGASTGFQNSGGSSTLSWINTLTVNVGSVAGVNLTNSGTPPSPTLVTAGAGEHYLKLTEPAVVSWFDARPSSLQPPSTDLATELAQTTVMAPVQLPATITSDLTLSRGVDPTLTSPELRIGYHYWPIHFLSSGATITGAKLYLTNGVVVAGTGSALVNLGSNSSFLSWGRPEVLNRLCWVSSVQELPTGGAPAGARQLLAIPSGNTLWPEIQLRLTRVELNADSSYTRRGLFDTSTTDRNLALAKLRDSQFFGTWLNFAPVTYGNQTFDLGNCVFEECRVEAYKNYSGTPSVLVRNCLVRNGTFILYHYWVDPSVPPWTCTDNLFATTGASAYSTSTNRLYAGWNGYTGSSAVFGGISNKVSLNQDWASGGPLGPWYYPTAGTSPSLAVLRNVGSRSAASAELYHYTTQVNQLKDGMDNASQVDIGFHYPAVSGGSWADSDGDGLPDVVEDNDGDGVVDSNETDWTQADTDGDGALDGEESSGSTDPKDKTSWIPKRLAAWWWDNAGGTWRNGDRGQTPIQTGAEINALGAVSNGVKISASTNSLRYRVVEADGRANLRLDQGSVRLWFKPNDWQLPSYPVGSGSLVGLGDPNDNNLGWWAWYFEYPTNAMNPLYLKFGQGTANVKYEMPTSGSDWSTNKWYELALSYNTNFIRLYRNGVLLAPSFYTRINTNILPTTSGINNGFALGTDVTGQYHIGGTLDCVETFNYSVETVENYRNHQLTLLTVTNGGFAQLQLTRNYEGWPVPSGINSAEPFPDPRPMTVWRRILGTAGWPTNALLSNSTNQTWIDTSVTAGIAYEYKVQFVDPFSNKNVRHISAGIGIPPQHQRGTALVMVDNTLAPNLTTELNQLTTNLVGDGWLVKLWTNAPRHDDATFSNNPPAMATVVNWITNNHTSGATNVIFIIGHVTIPYSGTIASDGHPDHGGAWTCDGYYGFKDKAPWVDTANVTGNVPNDGKFDLNSLPGVPDFAVGRIDFSNLPLFSGLGEVDLIKRYLQKDFRYRRAETPTFGRVTSCFQKQRTGEGVNAAQTFSGVFGVASGTLVSANSLASKVPADLSVHYSSGVDSSVADVGFAGSFDATNFGDATKEVPVTFRNVWFSYACDWARLNSSNANVLDNNWLRASLGWTNYGLATMGGFWWDFSCLGAGAPLAETMRRGYRLESGEADRFQSILGDPTLRLHRVAPPKAIAVTRSGSNATLTWTPSDDTGCVYYIYRSTNGIAGPFSLLNSNDPIPVFTFSDPNSASNYIYQVRACRLQQTGCGSFWNTSQGVFGKAP